MIHLDDCYCFNIIIIGASFSTFALEDWTKKGNPNLPVSVICDNGVILLPNYGTRLKTVRNNVKTFNYNESSHQLARRYNQYYKKERKKERKNLFLQI